MTGPVDTNQVPLSSAIRSCRQQIALALRLVAAILVTMAGLWLVPSEASATPAAIVTDAGCTTNAMARNDDGSAGPSPLGFTINYFGDQYSNLWVNNNGNVTFDNYFSSYSGLVLGSIQRPIIAPLFYDVDTRAGASSVVTYGAITYQGHAAYCVNWVNVGYYSMGTNPLNSSQLIIVDRSDVEAGAFDIVFNYNHALYEPAGGLTSGYASASGAYYELPGSRTSGALVDSNATTGLINKSVNSAGVLGRYTYNVRGGLPPQFQTITFNALANRTVIESPFTVSATSSAGLTVAFAAAGACTVSGTTVTLTTTGTCTITASQAGDADHAAATSVARSFTVTKASQRAFHLGRSPANNWMTPASLFLQQRHQVSPLPSAAPVHAR